MSEKLTFDISWRGLRSIDCNCCIKETHISKLKISLSGLVFQTKNIDISMPLEFVSWMTFIYLNTWVDCVVIITFWYVVLRYVTLRELLTRSCFKGGLWSCVRAERTNDVTASAPHSRILAWECWHTYRNKHVIVSWNVFSVNVETSGATKEEPTSKRCAVSGFHKTRARWRLFKPVSNSLATAKREGSWK